mgnify:CR=1 FL=1
MAIRGHLRHIGEEAGVPIEPPEQVRLIDATMKVPGVLAAGVPGGTATRALSCPSPYATHDRAV